MDGEAPASPLPCTSGEEAGGRCGRPCQGSLTSWCRGVCGCMGGKSTDLLSQCWQGPLCSHIEEWPVGRCSSSLLNRSCRGFIARDFAFCEERRKGRKKKKKNTSLTLGGYIHFFLRFPMATEYTTDEDPVCVCVCARECACVGGTE